jgi:four helix bundle protein
VAKGDDIEERLITFAVQIIKLCNGLPNSIVGRHFAGQLLRSGTSPAAHYAEARGAESTRDFVHKLKICLKELNETRVWLKIIITSDLLANSNFDQITQENDELCRIINASIKTASSRKT